MARRLHLRVGDFAAIGFVMLVMAVLAFGPFLAPFSPTAFDLRTPFSRLTGLSCSARTSSGVTCSAGFCAVPGPPCCSRSPVPALGSCLGR